MSVIQLGNTIVIANPTSHSGRGAAGADVVKRFFETYDAPTTSFDMWLTTDQGDASRMAEETAGADTLLVIGGDGVIHEVINGLMKVPADKRPRLGVIPMGSGNDYARTLGLSLNHPEASLHELLTGSERTMDLGFVSSDAQPEGVYIAETLSFGLDAAIALDTTKRRAVGTKQEGSTLFLTSSLKMFARARKGYPSVVSIDGGEEQRLETLIFAVQNGPTYGGGFRICPDAALNDGKLDVCYNIRHPWVPHLLFLLGLARFGRHTVSRAVRLQQVERLSIAFDQETPCQVDGEEFRGTSFEAHVVPRALRVLAPKSLN